jgi:cytochrome P450
MVFLLIVAGHETTVNLIGNGVLALLTHPDQLAKLKNDPGLIKTAIEEFLRYRSPVMTSTDRWAREDVLFEGQQIKRGEHVLVILAAANHDPAVFDDGEELDITRPENRHLAFGKGIHFCLGAPLARLEGQIAISTLLKRLPDLRLNIDPQDLQWRPGLLILGLTSLPVAF